MSSAATAGRNGGTEQGGQKTGQGFDHEQDEFKNEFTGSVNHRLRRICATVAALIASATLGVDGTAAKPNILLIVSDDQGYHDLGAINDEIITPNLDRLAAEGTRA